jgi:hypothetical protein
MGGFQVHILLVVGFFFGFVEICFQVCMVGSNK